MFSMQCNAGQRMPVHAGCSNSVRRLRTGSAPSSAWRMHGAVLAARQQRRQPALSCRCRAASPDDDRPEQPGCSQQLDAAQRHRLESASARLLRRMPVCMHLVTSDSFYSLGAASGTCAASTVAGIPCLIVRMHHVGLELPTEEAAPRLREAQPADIAQQQPAPSQPAQLPGLIRRLQAPLGAGLLAGLLGMLS